MVDAHPQDTRKATLTPTREARRRAASLRRKREKQLRDERKRAINNPGEASIRPVAVSVKDFRRMVGVSHATTHRWLKDGLLKSVKINGRRLIAFDEVTRVRDGE